MNVLIVGGSKAGAWAMRGVQLGAALGARVTGHPTADDVAWANVIVLVKRAILEHGLMAKRSGKPVVWDALDFWSQPAQNGLDEASALLTCRQHTARVQPDLVIGATEAMARAIGGVYLSHHCWIGLTPAPARETVSVVAYQGGEVYLGRWRGWIEAACATRGWRFVVNPADLREADILVAFRDGIWDGWICRQWKSGVKLVNARAAGRPIITQWSAAFRELDVDGTAIETPDALDLAFDKWAAQSVRQSVVDRARAFTVEDAAARYRLLLERVLCPA